MNATTVAVDLAKSVFQVIKDAGASAHHCARWLDGPGIEVRLLIDRKTPRHLELHLIVENQATNKRPIVQAWLARHPRLIVHPNPPMPRG